MYFFGIKNIRQNTASKLTMDKSKKRKVCGQNVTYNGLNGNATWAESFAFTADKTGLTVC